MMFYLVYLLFCEHKIVSKKIEFWNVMSQCKEFNQNVVFKRPYPLSISCLYFSHLILFYFPSV